jgi:hypothetical protein
MGWKILWKNTQPEFFFQPFQGCGHSPSWMLANYSLLISWSRGGQDIGHAKAWRSSIFDAAKFLWGQNKRTEMITQRPASEPQSSCCPLLGEAWLFKFKWPWNRNRNAESKSSNSIQMQLCALSSKGFWSVRDAVGHCIRVFCVDKLSLFNICLLFSFFLSVYKLSVP